MLVDHLGFVFFPQDMIWRMIGRLSFPLFAFGIAQGYTYTRSWLNYLIRLLVLAFLSQPIFSLLFKVDTLNIAFTLALGLLAIHCYEKIKVVYLKYPVLALLLFSAWYFNVEYGSLGVLLIFLLYVFRHNFLALIISGSIIFLLFSITLLNPIYIMAIPSLFLMRIMPKKRISLGRYFFYFFYPGHLLLLFLIKVLSER